MKQQKNPGSSVMLNFTNESSLFLIDIILSETQDNFVKYEMFIKKERMR